MGLLDGVLGGVLGAEVTSLVSHAIEQHGGVSGLVAQFEQQGLGNVVQSWIGKGPNLPISPDQLNKVLGSATVQQMAAKLIRLLRALDESFRLVRRHERNAYRVAGTVQRV